MTDLTQIPGIGKKMAGHLVNIGYPDIQSLKGQDPEEIYAKHCLLYEPGNQSCKCVLYCYRLAVHYADPGCLGEQRRTFCAATSHNGELPPDKQNWGDWKNPL